MPATRTIARARSRAAGQRRGEAAERLGHHDQIAAQVPRRAGHRVGVLGEPGRVVLARQVRRDRLMAPGAQLLLHQVPVPAHVGGTMDQRKRGHLITSLPERCQRPRHGIAAVGKE